ncbi:MAG TPA: RNA-processing protein [Nanoarchaeota archaeon]|nr:RNA-processing protein [Nanoarchaeota archaeon]
MQFEEEILIPKARVKVVLSMNTLLEKENAKIEAVGNLIKIVSDDALILAIAKNIVEAVGRGFEPGVAKLLFKDDFAFEQLSIADYGYKKPNHLKRIKGVVIGENGKAKNIIEKRTGTRLAIYGKTVSIIGKHDAVQKARHAVEMLLTGRRHATAYRFLEKVKEFKGAE